MINFKRPRDSKKCLTVWLTVLKTNKQKNIKNKHLIISVKQLLLDVSLEQAFSYISVFAGLIHSEQFNDRFISIVWLLVALSKSRKYCKGR